MIKRYVVTGTWSKTLLGNPEMIINETNKLIGMYPHLNMEVLKVDETDLNKESEEE